ncbi:MAG: 3'-5' exonuclease, partial [Bifidobacteriaceae bacterium]|nr:3'-5' exonuclease [Bifidobacteriaceae bacterium]
YKKALENAGFKTIAVGYSSFREHPEVKDILSVLRALQDKTNAEAYLRVLATPRLAVRARDLRLLAEIANEQNRLHRYEVLAKIGVVPEVELKKDKLRLEQKHRSEVPNAIFLGDILCNKEYEHLIVNSDISEIGKEKILFFSHLMQYLQQFIYHDINELVFKVCVALNVDIDGSIADAIEHENIHATQMSNSIYAMDYLATAFKQELTVNERPTLSGFLAWIDCMSDFDDVENLQAANQESADVILLSVHQAKGLEWDAVAVVDMNPSLFPSNAGDNLKIVLDELECLDDSSAEEKIETIDAENESYAENDSDQDIDVNEIIDGKNFVDDFKIPAYISTAKSWLEKPLETPVPARTDYHILPNFPHDSRAQTFDEVIRDIKNLLLDEQDLQRDDLDSRTIISVANNLVREACENYNSISKNRHDIEDGYLSQREEYGTRRHIEERRLAYVAITRAKYDVLLLNVNSNSQNKPNISNFWQEVYDGLQCDAVKQEVDNDTPIANYYNSQRISEGIVIEGEKTNIADVGVRGYFIGDDAQEYLDAVVGNCLENEEPKRKLRSWPIGLSEKVAGSLSGSVERVERMGNSGNAAQLSLTQQAQRLVNDSFFMDSYVQEDESADTQLLIERAKQVVEGKYSYSVSDIQRGVLESGNIDEQTSKYIMRPLPLLYNEAPEDGTQFHDWAEAFVTSYNKAKLSKQEQAAIDEIRKDDNIFAQNKNENGLSREQIIAQVEQLNTTETSLTPNERKFNVWKQRLVSSPWAYRVPIVAEYALRLRIPQWDNRQVIGKADAVFLGGIDSQDENKRITIIDWKTGVRPTREQDIAHKLEQLDIYRLLFSRAWGIPIEQIDAALYYVSEEKEENRIIPTVNKTQEEILNQYASA